MVCTLFTIYEPKERFIGVVPFIDRVMHHAIMNVLEPVFEKQFIFHTYACRKGNIWNKIHKTCKVFVFCGIFFNKTLDYPTENLAISLQKV